MCDSVNLLENTTPLGEVFRINTAQITPRAFADKLFTHYSIPAFDELHGPAIEPSETIESNKFWLSNSCVLVSKLNPRKPRVKTVVNPGECTCASTEFICFEPRSDHQDLRFWEAYFTSGCFSTRLAKVAVGSTNSHTRAPPKETLNWLVPNPPVALQSKIAEILDTLDAAIRGTEAVVAKLMVMKQGLLHDLLTRGIGANGDLRPSQLEAPHLYKQTPLGWLPKEWDYSTLASAIATIDSGWSPACIETPPPAGEWGVLKVSAVTRGFYDDRQSKTLPSGMKPRPTLEVHNGDVILTRANGVAELVGKTVQVQNTQEKLMLSDKLLRLVPDRRKMTNDFLAMLMTSDTIVRQIEKSMSGSSGQKNISQSQIKSFACFIPLVDEQDEIAVRAAAFEARAAAEERELDKLRLQKSGLMEDLLTGRKPVTALL
ncbi:restriction endonuclease subunit S [Agrobacterium tumefaciens]|uniref:restriction endonuclease subunit S n=1 Tax=Agrobacterium tumefaciens TaxID=358 RepID=UPI001CBDACB2|nr:restriction endonuclease subunit S [Agrobacterium tumefaciens]